MLGLTAPAIWPIAVTERSTSPGTRGGSSPAPTRRPGCRPRPPGCARPARALGAVVRRGVAGQARGNPLLSRSRSRATTTTVRSSNGRSRSCWRSFRRRRLFGELSCFRRHGRMPPGSAAELLPDLQQSRSERGARRALRISTTPARTEPRRLLLAPLVRRAARQVDQELAFTLEARCGRNVKSHRARAAALDVFCANAARSRGGPATRRRSRPAAGPSGGCGRPGSAVRAQRRHLASAQLSASSSRS